MGLLRRLDHVAIIVRDTDHALEFYRDHLGLAVHSTEELLDQQVRLTYLDAGNTFLQLVEPLRADSQLAAWLEERGEGLHHICFGVDDVPAAVAALSDDHIPVSLGSGRGRVSAFVATSNGNGVRIECTEFDHAIDVDDTHGWLTGPGHTLRSGPARPDPVPADPA